MSRHRFVKPETVRIDISDGDFIVIKKRLTVGEQRQLTLGHVKGVKKDDATGEMTYDVDGPAMALARVETYLVEWSFADEQGRVQKVSADAIHSLDEESFGEIEAAILAHIEALEQEKKERIGTSGSS